MKCLQCNVLSRLPTSLKYPRIINVSYGRVEWDDISVVLWCWAHYWLETKEIYHSPDQITNQELRFSQNRKPQHAPVAALLNSQLILITSWVVRPPQSWRKFHLGIITSLFMQTSSHHHTTHQNIRTSYNQCNVIAAFNKNRWRQIFPEEYFILTKI